MDNTKNEAYKTTFPHLSNLADEVGNELGLSDWINISQDKINQFATLTGDEQWIHIDVERSKKESPYKKTVAHGFMILSMASQISYQAFGVEDVVMGVNYGLDKVRFMNATPAGANVRGRVSLMAFDPFEGGAKYKMKVVFEIEGVEKPACVAEFIAMAYTGK